MLVLAAGRGKRMGTPKALMEVEGRVWWQMQAAAIERLGLESTWVVSPEVRDAMEASGGCPSELVLGEPDSPMFTSLVVGLERLREEQPRGVFVLPVDVPVASRTVWDLLAGGGRVVVPRVGGRSGHPVYLRWDWIEEVLFDGEMQGRRLDEMVRPAAVFVDVLDRASVLNLNTPEDVVAWKELSR